MSVLRMSMYIMYMNDFNGQQIQLTLHAVFHFSENSHIIYQLNLAY